MLRWIRPSFMPSCSFVANPLYEQLTVSRAAHIEKRVPVRCVRTSSSLLNRPSERSAHAPFQSLNYEQTSIKVTSERQKTKNRKCQETPAHCLHLASSKFIVQTISSFSFASPSIRLALQSIITALPQTPNPISYHNGSLDHAVRGC